MKDYLQSQNVLVKFSRDVIKQAFFYEIIDDGDIWLEMLEQRNLITHTYNEDIFNEVVDKVISRLSTISKNW